jgi:hypothetical protein
VRTRHESLVRAHVARYHGRWIEEKGVESLSDVTYVSPVSRAMVHVGLGEHDPALKALEQGIRDRDFRVI